MAAMRQDSRDFALLSGEPRRTPKRLIFSYLLDWMFIILLVIVGAILYSITGSEHVFSLDDPSISYPLKTDTVSIVTVGIVCCAVPALLIAALSLLLPIPWRLRLWEWHAGWLGLGLSLAGAFFITSGLKDVVGKPRPDLLARCQPNLSSLNITAYAVSGLGVGRPEAPVMVTTRICQATDSKTLRDGFAGFPSGHSSFSWSGLLYLSLWLGAKFARAVPASPAHYRDASSRAAAATAATAAPPVYLLVLTVIPIGGALYICGTRYMDYMHAGWDILGGSLIGIVFAILGFRWYHAPAGQGDGGWGYALGPRSADHAFGVGLVAPGESEGDDHRQVENRAGFLDVELNTIDGGSQSVLRVANP
ncbi:phosphatase PAP2 family protein [Aspergillus brunneoviolaceus CBS 621.78]|uniref:Acid phosphatase/Vanadium-dependent haloperoxidase n=1 Tax=Aspergillus brunneoviolaceus CBS 621.78 TaxID=1450534 RepID=A0ACD1FXA2_9EURO|nr:acid phosphatase/Vanadium-dependent haloperoxidase [Aspergillus brunneoviolaceus CBS 621.78]RAH41579.1 acid phosphatase/Vanadium-dependent haloperoxidase [Aspergillus brunneoviolaceus CBS 621.78]